MQRDQFELPEPGKRAANVIRQEPAIANVAVPADQPTPAGCSAGSQGASALSLAISRHPGSCQGAAKARDSGFTLLEILVVITIIGLLIGLVAPAALRQLAGARVSVAKQSIERLSTVLDLYNLDMGSYPTTEEGIGALVRKPAGAVNWNGPYLKGDAVPLDPWGHPFVYHRPSERPEHDYDLCTTGPNAEATRQDMICNP
jgi:general secretion pathway protein G